MQNLLETELQKAIRYMIENKLLFWKRQNDGDDRKSNFIYRTTKLSEVLEKCRNENLDEAYVLNRWYNFHTSKTCENIFISFGAKKEVNEKHKKIDFYIDEVPFDLKVTRFPNALKNNKSEYDLSLREGKNELIRWLYQNQSQQGRHHMDNRIFIVCDGSNHLKLKSDFDKIKIKVKEWVEEFNKGNRNYFVVHSKDGNSYKVYSDIIVIKDEE